MKISKTRGGKNHPRFQDLTGKINRDLKILEYINTALFNKIAKWRWKCECVCGKIIYVRTARLNGTEAKQERCKKCQSTINGKKLILSDYLSIKNALFSVYKNKAQKRKLEFILTFEEFNNLIKQNCYYCGKEPEIHAGDLYKLNEKEPFKRNGIDRKNNFIGYIIGNCVPCCTMCNFAKLHFSMQEYSDWLKRLYKFNNKELWN